MSKTENQGKFFQIKRRSISFEVDKTVNGRPVTVLAKYKDYALTMQFTLQKQYHEHQLMKVDFTPPNVDGKQSYLQKNYKIHSIEYLRKGDYLDWRIRKSDLLKWSVA